MGTNIYAWSQTAASNNTADADINWNEGQLHNTVNDSARTMMAAVARNRDDINGTLATAGTSTAYTVTTNTAYASLASGIVLVLKANASNTGAATLTVTPNGGAAFAAKAIRKVVSGGADAALVAGDIQGNQMIDLIYDSTANAAAGGWILLNPAVNTSGFAPTASPTFTGTLTAPTINATTAYQFNGTTFTGAWTSYSSNAAPTSGAFSSASSSGFYVQIGKIVHFKAEVVITLNGTGAGTIQFSLPVQSASDQRSIVVGRTSAGNTCHGNINTSSTVVGVIKYDSTYPGGDGVTVTITGTYEAA